MTDDNGAAEFNLDVPAGTSVGPRLLTIGVDDVNTALTADRIVDIVSCPPDLDGNATLTIFDFLSFQNAWQAGEEIGDYDGDDELTIFDFLAYQNAFQAACP
jgi:hypothetical protein